MSKKKIILGSLLFVILCVGALGIKYSLLSPDERIVLGASLPLTGINSHLGKDIVIGASTYFNHANAQGGIRGKLIDFIYYDDQYEPENTYTNTQILLDKDDAFALFGFVGTPTVKRIIPLISDTSIPFIAPYTGASFLREPSVKNIINFRSSYNEEVDALVEYLAKERGITKFAIFYQNDDYGEEGYIALNTALKKHHLELSAEGMYKRNTLSIRHAINEIENAKPEAIILVGAYKPTARFIEKIRECCPSNIIFCSISFVNPNALVDELKGDAHNIIFSQTVPSYDDQESKEAREYSDLLTRYFPKESPSLVSFESFLAAKTVVEALRDTEGTLTRKKLISALRNVKSSTLQDIPLTFHHTQLLNRVYLSEYQNRHFNIIRQYGN